MYQWCQKWRVVINNDKTKVIHFRRHNVKQTEVRFRIGNTGSVLRLYNQIVQMPENRLARKVFEYDVNHCEQVVNCKHYAGV